MLNVIYFDFVKFFKFFFLISIILFIFCFFFILKSGFNFSSEFLGGIELEISYEKKINISDLKTLFSDLQDVKISYYGSGRSVQIKLKNNFENKFYLLNIIKNLVYNDASILRIDYVGPEVSKNIIRNSFIAMFFSFILMYSYLFFRFGFVLSFGAILALLNNIFFVLGFISFFCIEFNLVILTSVFVIFGYSINDTIIILDRFRELKKKDYSGDYKNILNFSFNSTLSRTFSTVFSTLIVILVMLFFGTEYLFYFSIILLFGILMGSYSSIFIAFLPFYYINSK